MSLWKLIGVAAVAAIAAGIGLAVLATRDVRALEERLAAERLIAETRHGPIEYLTWGNGAPVVVLHGAGGGFDQGRLIAEAYGGDGFRWIAPSRFGYLGSPLPADASTAAQADAIADLLDQLGVQRAAILGFSGGAPPALQFAERHPNRTAALVLLSSAPFTPYAPDPQTRPVPDWLYQALFGNDVIYWTLANVSPGSLEQAFDARPELRADLPEEERRFVERLVRAFLPASRRAAGVRNERAAIDPAAAYALERIGAPTLVIHARDDRINSFDTGLAISQRIANVEFLPLESGGHLLLGRHAGVRSRVSAFLTRSFGAPGESRDR